MHETNDESKRGGFASTNFPSNLNRQSRKNDQSRDSTF